MIPIHPIPDPWLEGAHQICSACGCFAKWPEQEPNPKDEWCSEPTPFIGFRSCFCHSADFWNGYHREMDRMDIKREEVLAELPFSSFRDDVA